MLSKQEVTEVANENRNGGNHAFVNVCSKPTVDILSTIDCIHI
jgi:hypothetical protein